MHDIRSSALDQSWMAHAPSFILHVELIPSLLLVPVLYVSSLYYEGTSEATETMAELS
jgi:hypothetical protein